MAMAGTAMDPNVDALKKRLYGQVAGQTDPTMPKVSVPSMSPDFTPSQPAAGAAPPNLTKLPPPDFPVPPTAPGSPRVTAMSPAPATAGGVDLGQYGEPGGFTGGMPGAYIPPDPPPYIAPMAPSATPSPAPADAAAPTGDLNQQLVQLLNQGMSREEAVAQLTKGGAAPGTFNIKGDNSIGYRTDPNGTATGYVVKNPQTGAWQYGQAGYDAAGNRMQAGKDIWGNASASDGSTSASGLQAPTATPTGAITGSTGMQTNAAPHTPGSGVPGVYDFDNAGNPIDAFGRPYTGPLTGDAGGGSSSGSGYNDKIRQMLMDRLKELGTPVDENSAGISGAIGAARDEGNRASATERTALAEHLYAEGGGGLQSGAIGQQIQQSGEKNAAALGSLRANLLMGEYARKQAALTQTLSMAVQSGDAEAARQAQKAIADLQAQLQREGFGLDAAKYAAYLNQHTIEMGLGG